MQKFNVSVSITDFSLVPFGLEPLFNGLKKSGADGLEIVVGIKSRWSSNQLKKLSEKYELPITTLHQPPWSGLGFWLDEGFMKQARELDVKGVVIHPRAFVPLLSEQSQQYLETLARWQDKYKMQVMLENAPARWKIKVMDTFFPMPEDVASMQDIAQKAKDYGFLVNLDIAHSSLSQIQTDKTFQTIFPQIGSFHLSSFTDEVDHLPLDQGLFDTKSFIQYLYKKNYKGLITFEIYYPKQIQFSNYDFKAIQKSIQIVKSVKPK